MIRIENVTTSIVTGQGGYNKKEGDPELFVLSASITSDSREFLERVNQAIHLELAYPSAAEPKPEKGEG